MGSRREPGWQQVAALLPQSCISTVNLTEVLAVRSLIGAAPWRRHACCLAASRCALSAAVFRLFLDNPLTERFTIHVNLLLWLRIKDELRSNDATLSVLEFHVGPRCVLGPKLGQGCDQSEK